MAFDDKSGTVKKRTLEKSPIVGAYRIRHRPNKGFVRYRPLEERIAYALDRTTALFVIERRYSYAEKKPLPSLRGL